MRRNLQGFTLLELVIAIAVFAGIGLGLFFAISSQDIIDKARDARRFNDIKEFQKALELYYQDNECYPTEDEFELVLTAQEEGWAENGNFYMREVPLDPNNYPYVYKTSDENCPQWMGVFAKLSYEQSRFDACPVAKQSHCVPSGIDETWACATSGSVDCEYLAGEAISIPDEVEESTVTPTPTIQQPTNTPVPTNTPTPTPTPDPNCTPKNYACTGSPLRCNIVPAGQGTYCSSNCDGAC